MVGSWFVRLRPSGYGGLPSLLPPLPLPGGWPVRRRAARYGGLASLRTCTVAWEQWWFGSWTVRLRQGYGGLPSLLLALPLPGGWPVRRRAARYGGLVGVRTCTAAWEQWVVGSWFVRLRQGYGGLPSLLPPLPLREADPPAIAPARQGRSDGWWTRQDLNLRPSGCQPDALPTELRARRRGDSHRLLRRRVKFGHERSCSRRTPWRRD